MIDVEPGAMVVRPVFVLAIGLIIGTSWYFHSTEEPAAGLRSILEICFIAGWLALAVLWIFKREAPAIFVLVVALLSGFVWSVQSTQRILDGAPPGFSGRLLVSGQVIDRFDYGSRKIIELDHLHIAGEPPFSSRWRAVLRVGAKRTAEHARIGAWVRVRIRPYRVRPPSVPGGVDFVRHQFFARIALRGVVSGGFERIAGPGRDGFGRRLHLLVARARDGIASRIDEALDGQAAALGQALTIGRREALGNSLKADMRDSGLAHILAISGLHLGLAGGFFYFSLRLAMACIPWLVLYLPIKKIAAVVAILFTAFYLALAGASVSTQRAFVMTSLAFFAILVDRSPLNMRLLALAAILALVGNPASVAGASFQMSFAAVFALIAFFTRARGALARLGSHSLAARLLAYVLGLAASSLVASLATAPFAAFHFHRLAIYGLAANLVALPIFGFLVMPMLALGVLFSLFDAHTLPFALAGRGMDFIVAIAQAIRQIEGSVRLIPAFSPLILAVMASGLLLFGLAAMSDHPGLRAGTACSGLAALVLGLFLAMVEPRPLARIARGGELAAFTMPTGAVVMKPGPERSFIARYWLARSGQRKPEKLPDSLQVAVPAGEAASLRCDETGCVVTVRGSRLIWAHDPGSLIEDCANATLLVAAFTVPDGVCTGPGLILDRQALLERGGIEIYAPDEQSPSSVAGPFSVTSGAGSRPWRQLISQGVD